MPYDLVYPFTPSIRHEGASTSSHPRREGHAGRWSIRRTGQALMAACLLLPIALFGVDLVDDRATFRAQVERDVENTTNVVEQNAHNTFETYKLVANLVDEHIRGLSWREIEESERLHQYLAGLVRDYPRIRGLTVIDRDGKARASNLAPEVRIPSFVNRDYFVALKNQDVGTVTGLRVRSFLTSDDVLIVARRRSTPDGGFDGVIVVSALPDSFIRFWRTAAAAGITAVYRSDGALLARNPDLPRDILGRRVEKDLIDASRAADRGTLSSVSTTDGLNWYLSFRKISGFPIFIVHGVNLEEALRPWRLEMMRDFGLFGIVDACLVLLALWVNRRARREEAALADRSEELRAEAQRRAKVEMDLASVLRDTVERQEADRSRIARDLHDGLGQHVAMLHLGLDDIDRQTENATRVRELARRLKSTATDVSHEIGRIAWELRPVGLDELGLGNAIQTYIEMLSVRVGLQFDLHIAPGGQRLNPSIEIALYRVVQEGLTNIIRHAGATRVCIVLNAMPNEVRLVIEDDGKGFALRDGDMPATPGAGLGILGMQERLSLLGGRLEIETAPGRGTALLIKVPT
jgi:signal transduction histidine kinase